MKIEIHIANHHPQPPKSVILTKDQPYVTLNKAALQPNYLPLLKYLHKETHTTPLPQSTRNTLATRHSPLTLSTDNESSSGKLF